MPENNEYTDRVPVRTRMGHEKVRESSDREFPRALRNLLIMIDDKTSVAGYQQKLQKYSAANRHGGVLNMLEELVQQQLIEFRSVNEARDEDTRVTIASAIKINPDDFINEEDFQDYLPPMDPDMDLLANLKQCLQGIVGECDHGDSESHNQVIGEVESLTDFVEVIRTVWQEMREYFSRDQRHQVQVLYKLAKTSF